MSLAPCDAGNRDDDNSVGRDSIRGPRRRAAVALTEPEIRHAQPYGMNTLGVDGKPLAKQFSCISAVGGDIGARPEHAQGSDREALQWRLGLVDLRAMDGHQDARLGEMP